MATIISSYSYLLQRLLGLVGYIRLNVCFNSSSRQQEKDKLGSKRKENAVSILSTNFFPYRLCAETPAQKVRVIKW